MAYNPRGYSSNDLRYQAWVDAGRPAKDDSGNDLDVRGEVVGNDAWSSDYYQRNLSNLNQQYGQGAVGAAISNFTGGTVNPFDRAVGATAPTVQQNTPSAPGGSGQTYYQYNPTATNLANPRAGATAGPGVGGMAGIFINNALGGRGNVFDRTPAAGTSNPLAGSRTNRPTGNPTGYTPTTPVPIPGVGTTPPAGTTPPPTYHGGGTPLTPDTQNKPGLDLSTLGTQGRSKVPGAAGVVDTSKGGAVSGSSPNGNGPAVTGGTPPPSGAVASPGYEDYLDSLGTERFRTDDNGQTDMAISRQAWESATPEERMQMVGTSGGTIVDRAFGTRTYFATQGSALDQRYRAAHGGTGDRNYYVFGVDPTANPAILAQIRDPSQIWKDPSSGQWVIPNEAWKPEFLQQQQEAASRSGLFRYGTLGNILLGSSLVLGGGLAANALGAGAATSGGAASTAGAGVVDGYMGGIGAGGAGTSGATTIGGTAAGAGATAGATGGAAGGAAAGGAAAGGAAAGSGLFGTGVTAGQVLGGAGAVGSIINGAGRLVNGITGGTRTGGSGPGGSGGGPGGSGGGSGGGLGGLGDIIAGGINQDRNRRNINEYRETLRTLIERGDPYGPERADAIRRLRALEANPGSVVDNPLFASMSEKSQNDLARRLGARGYTNSGNEQGALQENFLANMNKFYGDEWTRTAREAGVFIDPGTSVSAGLTGAGNVLRATNNNDAATNALLARIFGNNGGNGGNGSNGGGSWWEDFERWWNSGGDDGGDGGDTGDDGGGSNGNATDVYDDAGWGGW